MKYSVAPKKSLGQHFLHNDHYARKIVDSLDLKPADFLVEIGPGTGALTRFFYPELKERYIGIEIDDRAVADLKSKFGEDINILHKDFMKSDPSEWLLPDEKVKVVGNVPYYITTPILFRVHEVREKVSHLVVMIQKEVAQRIVAPPGGKEYGILSVQFQQAAKCELLFKVPPGAFFPPPTVDSAVIRMTFYDQAPFAPTDPEFFQSVVRQAFHARRKTLKNNLKSFTGSREDFSVDLSRRAETLSVEEFVRLTNELDALRFPQKP
ncbi:MAG: 16S rRNA (adenine(1518)-N(6)/adenine(1519)-N(6))-dimethyltransferase RsmA [Bacteroidetes bacterium]|nr:16S rRNA (adenine(1518)-N(6)/adenine(1519)-N(6))-dimethyltransferase RsmA [Bacteroidota bacterium]